MNKKLLALAGLGITAAPIVAVVSCSSSSATTDAADMLKKLNYDFGLATAPINNLNYLRNNLGPAQESIIYPIVQAGPKGTLKSVLQLPEFKMQQLKQDPTGQLVTSGRFYTLSQFGEYAGAVSPSENAYAYLQQDPNDSASPLSSAFIKLNNKNH